MNLQDLVRTGVDLERKAVAQATQKESEHQAYLNGVIRSALPMSVWEALGMERARMMPNNVLRGDPVSVDDTTLTFTACLVTLSRLGEPTGVRLSCTVTPGAHGAYGAELPGLRVNDGRERNANKVAIWVAAVVKTVQEDARRAHDHHGTQSTEVTQ